MSFELLDYQLDAVKRMHNGCILCGGVGSGKSLTSLGYYYVKNGGDMNFLKGGKYVIMKKPRKLYIITTAMKRDTREWEKELLVYLLSTGSEPPYNKPVVIDSWNNIKKYENVKDAFFIFDEQRVVGYGTWTKTFLKIAKENKWILLTATPGDTWSDYMPVFIANGFYKNKTHFEYEHVIYDPRVKFPKISRYVNQGKLIKYRNQVLVTMDYRNDIEKHHEDIYVKYDKLFYHDITKRRWNPYKDEPIKNAAELCYVWRKIVNSDISRQIAVLEIFEDHPRLIIFYNFDYELEILRGLGWGSAKVYERNSHKHDSVPTGDTWVYLVQYASGCEGWNCISTNAIVFFSQNYSYKTMTQAAGRIDRMNTPYKDLYYYHLKTRSGIDLGISKALKDKKNFNEGKYVKW